MPIYVSSLLVLVVGLLMFSLAKNNAEVKESGRIMFFAGLLAFLLQGAPALLR